MLQKDVTYTNFRRILHFHFANHLKYNFFQNVYLQTTREYFPYLLINKTGYIGRETADKTHSRPSQEYFTGTQYFTSNRHVENGYKLSAYHTLLVTWPGIEHWTFLPCYTNLKINLTWPNTGLVLAKIINSGKFWFWFSGGEC